MALNSLETADDLKLPAGSRLFTVCLSMKDGERRGGLLGLLLELEEETGVLGMLLPVWCPLLLEGGVMLMPPCVGVGRLSAGMSMQRCGRGRWSDETTLAAVASSYIHTVQKSNKILQTSEAIFLQSLQLHI